jgi:hypothetical protein
VLPGFPFSDHQQRRVFQQVPKFFDMLRRGRIGEWLVNEQRTELLPSLMIAARMLVNT